MTEDTMRNILIVVAFVIGLLLLGGVSINERVDDQTVQEITNLLTVDEIDAKKELPVLGTLPEIEEIASWINTEPLTREDLLGKVVLVDFWTYSCINCIRTLPYIESWWEQYKDEDFILLGMHTPEFRFEHDRDNVIKAMKKYNLTHPVGQDNDYTTWRNFNNRYWPAKYLFDKQGQLRYTHFGEGKYEETERAIQQLLAVDQDLADVNGERAKGVGSPETYFGYWRDENFSSPEDVQKDVVVDYSVPAKLDLNDWAFQGNWKIEHKHSEAQEAGAKFFFRYRAGVANVVMATADGKPQKVIVRLDGKEIGEIEVSFSDLYELIRQVPGEHVLEIETTEPGLQIFAITFG